VATRGHFYLMIYARRKVEQVIAFSLEMQILRRLLDVLHVPIDQKNLFLCTPMPC